MTVTMSFISDLKLQSINYSSPHQRDWDLCALMARNMAGRSWLRNMAASLSPRASTAEGTTSSTLLKVRKSSVVVSAHESGQPGARFACFAWLLRAHSVI